MIEIPSRSHASNMINDPCKSSKDREDDHGIGAILGKVGEKNRYAKAEENKEGSTKKGAATRIEELRNHRAVSRVEGLLETCRRAAGRE